MADETAEKTEETAAGQDESTATENAPQAAAEEATEPAATEPAATATAEEGDDTAVAGLTLGEGAPAQESEVRVASVIRGKIDKFGVAMGTGRRKTAVARVRIKDGDGKLTINGRELDEYFATERHQQDILGPLRATDSLGTVDVWVRVDGGGTTGQSGAIVLGIARALQAKNPTLHHILADGGYLTRDSRMVERKKYGLRKARRSFQFSKR